MQQQIRCGTTPGGVHITASGTGGEIVGSNVVRELVAGKGFLFSDLGDFVARGFEEPVRMLV